MAWTDVLDSVLAVGKPIRALHIRAIRDNIAALAAGLSGAPKIQNAAFANNSIAGDRLSTASVYGTKLFADAAMGPAVSAGNAALGVGAVGTYALMYWNFNSLASPGDLIAGSSLQYTGLVVPSGASRGDPVGFAGLGGAASGTWRLMGYANFGGGGGRLFLCLRIS